MNNDLDDVTRVLDQFVPLGPTPQERELGEAVVEQLTRRSETPPRLQTVRVEPGDVLVVTINAQMTISQAQRIRDELLDAFPDQRVIFVTDDVAINVYRPEEST